MDPAQDGTGADGPSRQEPREAHHEPAPIRGRTSAQTPAGTSSTSAESGEGEAPADLDPVALLVCLCLERYEDEGPSAIEGICEDHPQHADRIRHRISSLERLGLLPDFADESAEPRLPDRIGQYEVLRQIGRGGMGVVFEAQQESPRRRVALKVIRSGFLTATALRRFATETQLLGLLQHAHIAQIYEAGTTEIGGESLPYFAMEFVDGVPISVAVRRAGWDLPRRLALIATVADAIDYAHGRGVIHRDLKPGNVLVDARGEPKVLDFGLARASDPELSLTSVNTGSGQVLGTLAYMSPEQARGDSNLVDRSSDVYSLGVLGHELLVGELPYSVRDLNMLEAVRVICEDEPARLGSRASLLRGDVETIFSTAMAKEPARRYASAGAMAADIRRFLANEPILARPPSTWYQLSKAVRRNRGLFGGIAVAFALLIGGTAVSTTQWLRARAATGEATEAQRLESAARRGAMEALSREEQQRLAAQQAQQAAEAARGVEAEQREKAEQAERLAQRKAEVATSVTEVLTRMLHSPDPWRSPGSTEHNRDTKVIDVLDATVRELDARRDMEPEVEAEVRAALAQTYDGLGMYQAGLAQATRALELFAPTLGEQSAPAMEARRRIALCQRGLGRHDEARRGLEECVRWARAREEVDADTVTTLSDLALLYSDRGDVERALELLHEARRAVQASARPDVRQHEALIDHNLGSILQEIGRHEEAMPYLQSALTIRTAGLGAGHPRTLAVQNALGQILFARGDLDEAWRLQSDLVVKARGGVGEAHPFFGTLLVNLAQTALGLRRGEEARDLFQQAVDAADDGAAYADAVRIRAAAGVVNAMIQLGQYEEAVERALDAVDLAEIMLGDEHAMTALCYGVHALALLRRNQPQEAREQFRRSLAVYEATVGPDTLNSITVREVLITLARQAGELEEAAELARANAEGSARSFPDGHAQTVSRRLVYADLLRAMEDFDELELQLLEAFEESVAVGGRRDPQTVQVARRLVAYYDEMQLAEDAAEYRVLLEDPATDDDGAR